MSYQITLSLSSLSKDRIVRTLTPEDAAQAAWQLCVEHNLNMPNPSWRMKSWDSFEGAFENNPVTEHMVRGCPGKYPDKVEFMHKVIDALTENPRAGNLSVLMMRSGMPHTPAPASSIGRFEMTRGQKNSLVIEYMDDMELSVVDDFAPKLADVIHSAEEAGELDALVKLLEANLDILTAKKRKTEE